MKPPLKCHEPEKQLPASSWQSTFQLVSKTKRHMDFYFHTPYAIIKYLIKAVLITAQVHVVPVLLKWFVWYQILQIYYHYRKIVI